MAKRDGASRPDLRGTDARSGSKGAVVSPARPAPSTSLLSFEFGLLCLQLTGRSGADPGVVDSDDHAPRLVRPLGRGACPEPDDIEVVVDLAG